MNEPQVGSASHAAPTADAAITGESAPTVEQVVTLDSDHNEQGQ